MGKPSSPYLLNSMKVNVHRNHYQTYHGGRPCDFRRVFFNTCICTREDWPRSVELAGLLLSGGLADMITGELLAVSGSSDMAGGGQRWQEREVVVDAEEAV